MNKSRKLVPVLAAIGFALVGTMAQAVPVSLTVSAATFAPGAGYGIDVKNGVNDESGGKLLDVVFQPVVPFVPVNLGFNAAGSFGSFLLGTVALNELDTGSGANEGISPNEIDDLGISVSLTLVGLPKAVVSGLATAIKGPIADDADDYTLAWNPLTVDFDDAGTFQFTLNALTFGKVGTQDLWVTVTRLADAPSQVTPVPEPATLALAAIALAGIGASRRRRTA